MNFKRRMQYKIAMRRLVFIGLACYFIVQIILAKEKLESKKIATLVREVNSETVQYPAITACAYRNSDDVDNPSAIESFSNGPRNILSRHIYFYRTINGTWQKEINFANKTDDIAYHHNAIVRDSKYLAACVSFASPSTVPPVKGKNPGLYLNVSEVDRVYVYVHDNNQMFVPHHENLYGSQFFSIKSGFDHNKTYYYKITLNKVHVKEFDQPSERCSKFRYPNTSVCIASYIEKQLGCNPRIFGSSFTSKPFCYTLAELESLASMTTKFRQYSGNKIYETTGCLASCERDEYGKMDVTWSEKSSEPIKDLHMAFLIRSGSQEEKEEYLLYDTNSFIADVGGFMGLCLGLSLFSLYNEVVDLVVRLKSRIFGK